MKVLEYRNLIITRVLKTLPGFIICVVIGIIAKIMGVYIPSIGGASIAIFLGIAIGNTFGNNEIYDYGTKFAESQLLSYSIVLLGGTLRAQTILNLGIPGVSFIILQMIITILFTLLMGKKLGFTENFRFLMASGNAVCGSSAIAATAPAIEASDNDKGMAITIVNIMGTILMLILPLIGRVIFSLETVKTSALIGGILQSIGQVVASGSLVNDRVKDLSTIFKIVRIIFLVFVVLTFSTMKKNHSSKNNKNLASKIKVPWYVLGFFIMCLLVTIGKFSSQTSNVFKAISNNFEIIALAGIGMRVNFREIIKLGRRTLIYALGVALIQIISAICLIWIIF